MLGAASQRQPACVGLSSSRQPAHRANRVLSTAARRHANGCSILAACRTSSTSSRSSSSSRSRPLGTAARRPQAGYSRAASLQVFALDAAQPFDFEARMTNKLSRDKALTIGIVGFGTFGQFLAKRMVEAGHRVLATSRTPYYHEAAAIGAEYFEDADDFCEEHPDVVILATSILSTKPVLQALPLARLKRSTLVVDVLSVKVFPKQLLLAQLPPELDILCTHPMFGPDSGKGTWDGLNFMYDAVRVGREPRRQQRLENFISFFRGQGCRMVEMTCEEHDRQAASTQFVTHTVGRMLGAMKLTSTEINTRGFEALLQLVENTNHDSFDLYYGLFLYNANAPEELERLEKAFDIVKKELFGRLHAVARKSLLPDPTALPPTAAAAVTTTSAAAPRSNGATNKKAAGSSSGSDSDGGSSSSSSRGGNSTSGNSSVASLSSLTAAPAAAVNMGGKLKQIQEQGLPAANGHVDASKKK